MEGTVPVLATVTLHSSLPITIALSTLLETIVQYFINPVQAILEEWILKKFKPEERRDDEIYKPGHQCKNKQIYVMICDENEEIGEEEAGEFVVMEQGEDCKENVDDEAPKMGISLHALHGNTSDTTLRLIILVDSGSTHNFLDIKAARQLGCTMEATTPLKVNVADGFKIESDAKCKNFEWSTRAEIQY